MGFNSVFKGLNTTNHILITHAPYMRTTEGFSWIFFKYGLQHNGCKYCVEWPINMHWVGHINMNTNYLKL